MRPHLSMCAWCGVPQTRSRNSENNTGKFPDIVAALPGLLREGTQSVVLDCEAVGFERATGRILPFQVGPPDLPEQCLPCAKWAGHCVHAWACCMQGSSQLGAGLACWPADCLCASCRVAM